ncbi:MAG: hypothetical protein J6P38_07590 [Acetobacter sp.]|nr:hypothetical protein [Acetobacter sp.]
MSTKFEPRRKDVLCPKCGKFQKTVTIISPTQTVSFTGFCFNCNTKFGATVTARSKRSYKIQ